MKVVGERMEDIVGEQMKETFTCDLI